MKHERHLRKPRSNLHIISSVVIVGFLGIIGLMMMTGALSTTNSYGNQHAPSTTDTKGAGGSRRDDAAGRSARTAEVVVCLGGEARSMIERELTAAFGAVAALNILAKAESPAVDSSLLCRAHDPFEASDSLRFPSSVSTLVEIDGRRMIGVKPPYQMSDATQRVLASKRSLVCLCRQLLTDQKVCSTTARSKVGLSVLRKFLRGAIQVTQHLLQAVIDTASTASYNRIVRVVKTEGRDLVMDLFSSIDVSSPTQAVLEDTPPQASRRVVSLDYEGYGRRVLLEHSVQWAWEDTFQSRVGCFSMTRECERPEGCRFVCNDEFILWAPNADGSPRHHVFISAGSNGEFDWETTWLHKFKQVSRSGNHLDVLLTMDCTMLIVKPPEESEARKLCFDSRSCRATRLWVAPPELTNNTLVQWLQARVCVGVHQQHGALTIPGAFRFMDSVLLEEPQRESGERWDYYNYTTASLVSEVLVYHPTSRTVHTSTRPGRVTLLKVDVEYGEYKAFWDWLKEAHDVHGTSIREVDQIQLEIHRFPRDSSTLPSSVPRAAAWFDSLEMSLLNLGFVTVRHERNGYGYCCSEVVLVHYRYFLESELWMMSERGITGT